MPISEYDCRHGTSSDDLGRLQRDRRAAAPGDPGAAAHRRAAGHRAGPSAGHDPAGGVQAPAGAPGSGAGAGPRGGQAAAVLPRRPRATPDPRVGRRIRAILESELRPAGRVRARAEANDTGGVADGDDGSRGAEQTGDGRPRDRALRDIDAPRELVFEAFTQFRHLSRWWGPDGFTTTTRAFEFRVGGEWDFVMHGPDGTDYQEWISWTEIAPPERIAMLHGESHDDPNAFESVLTFAPDGAATRIEMRTVFPTKELRDEAVEKYHAIEGGQQTLSNLAAYVTEIVRKGAEG